MDQAAPDGAGSPRILVLRPGAIGDTLLTYPALLALRGHVSDAAIHVVGNPAAAPVLAAQPGPDGRPAVARWTAFDDPAVTGLFLPSGPSERAVRAFGPLAAAIAWCTDPEGALAANLRRLGATRVVVAPSRPAPAARVHVAAHLLATLRPLGIVADATGSIRPHRPPLLEVAPDWTERADELLRRHGLAGRPFVLVHPGSGSPMKNWPAERFAAVISALPDAAGAGGMLLAGPAEAEGTTKLCAALGSPVPVLRDLPLTVVAAVIRRARAYLGNDSGPTHLAGLLGVLTLALFGPTDPARWAPLGPRVRALRRQPLDGLGTDEVISELARLIKNPARTIAEA